MRDLKDFTRAEWMRLMPFQYGFKQVRNDVMQNLILRQRPKPLEKFLEANRHLRGRNVAQVIAFGQPWVVDFFLKMAGRYLADTTVLIFDNSRQASDRAKIEGVCREHNVHYLGLPWNPSRHANRSHGLAMTWIFHNVLRTIQPAIAGFIDHDLIPTERIEFTERLGIQPFYGRLIPSDWAWSLWAGYCIYDFSIVKDRPLNFLHDFSRGLDTGGRNWNCLYREFDRDKLNFAYCEGPNATKQTKKRLRKVRLVDNRWIHLGGVGYNDNFKLNADFFARIADLALAGANCHEIIAAVEPPRDSDSESTPVVPR